MKIEVSLFKDKKTGEYVSSTTGRDGIHVGSVYFRETRYLILETKEFEVPDSKVTLSDKGVIDVDTDRFNKVFYNRDDVKEALKEFDDWISTEGFTYIEINKKLKEIFGDDLI